MYPNMPCIEGQTFHLPPIKVCALLHSRRPTGSDFCHWSSLQPCNRALLSPFRELLAHGCTLATQGFGEVVPKGLSELLDTIATLGFSSAMDITGVNIVGTEQQGDLSLADRAATTKVNPLEAATAK
jgi:hypothetical protein